MGASVVVPLLVKIDVHVDGRLSTCTSTSTSTSTSMSIKLCQCAKSIKEPHIQCQNSAKPPDYQYCGIHARQSERHRILFKKDPQQHQKCIQHSTKGHESLLDDLKEIIMYNKFEQTIPLIEAFLKEHPEYIVTDGDEYGQTILHIAILAGSPELVEYLLRRWGQQLVNCCDDDEVSPLRCLLSPLDGVDHAVPKLARLLLELGAQSNLVDNEGNTVLDKFITKLEAMESNRGDQSTDEEDIFQVIRILKEFGATTKISEKDTAQIIENLREFGVTLSKQIVDSFDYVDDN